MYCLLTALTVRRTRFLAACLLAAVTIPAVSLVLNGLLYARGKILIPFLTLILLLCARTFCGFLQERQKPPLWMGVLCLIPWAAACVNKGRVLTDSYLLLDWLLLMGWILWMRCAERKQAAPTGADPCRRKKKQEIRIAVMLLVPCIASWTLQAEAGYVTQAQINFSAVRQSLESAQRSIEQTEADKLRNARWEILSEGYTMSNYVPLPQMQRTSMYSSMMQQSYGKFFYDTAGNAIPARNRVALVPGKNPLFNTLMGVRYVTVKAASGQAAGTVTDVQAQSDAAGSALPPGYEVICCENGYVTGRNENVLPIAFGTDRLLSQKEFTDRLQTIPAGEQSKLAEAHPDKAAQVRYLSFSRNFGKEAAMLAGLREAAGDYLVLMDADLQHPPALLPKMYRILRNSGGAWDLCGGRRRGRAGESKIRACLSRGFYRVWNRLSGMEAASGEGDFRMMRRCVADAILSLGEYNRYTKGIFSYVGFRTTWIEYEDIARSARESKWNLRSLLRYAAQGIFAFSDAPLKIAGPLGTGLIFLSLLTMLLPQTRGLTTFLLLFLAGMQLLILQVIGSYLARAYWELKGRPLYFIRERSEHGAK